MPKVSVIIPVYGVEKYIERCARSLFEQTLNDLEYIFVDDCTPDRSIEILKTIIDEYRLRFAEEKKTVRIERMPTNSGLPAVRRHGIQLATGDYIIHCDSDDWVDVDMYRAMYEKGVVENADVVVCDFCKTDGQEIRIVYKGGDINLNIEQFIEGMFIQKYHWSVCNKMVQRKIYEKIRYIYPVANMGEDMVLTMQNILYSNKLVYIQQPYYQYYVNQCSITQIRSISNSVKKFIHFSENLCLLKDVFDSNSYRKYFDLAEFRCMNILSPFISDEKCYALWKEKYKDMGVRLFLNPYVSHKDKIKTLLRLFRFYLK